MASSSSAPASSSASVAHEILEHHHKAPIWEKFDKVRVDGEIKAKCKSCGKLMAAASSNTTLARHSKSCIAKQAPESTQAQLSSTGHIWTYDQGRQRQRQMQTVVKKGLPFNFYDDSEMTSYFHEELQPKYQQVSRTTTRRDALAAYLQAKQGLINFFETFDGRVSLTSDVWTSGLVDGHSYICITCHWIDPDNWELNKRIICFQGFEFPHTGKAIYQVVSNTIREFKIKEKIMNIAFDNASNNGMAVKYLISDLHPMLEGIFFHTRCVCHVLNLIVQDSLGFMKDYVSKIKTMLRVIYSSKKKKQDFKKFVISQGKKFLGPSYDMPIRWNSTYKMLKRALSQKTLLIEFYNSVETHDLCESDWAVLEDYVNLLESFYRATTILSGVYYPTSSLVIENILLISETFKNYKTNEMWRPLILIMEEIFLKYYKDMPSMFSCAAALNPLMGVDGVENFIEEINRNLDLDESSGFSINISVAKFNSDFTRLYNFYDHMYGARPREETTQPKTKDALKNKMLELASRKKQRTSSTLNELGLYSKTQFQDYMTAHEIENFDILKWWKSKTTVYPILALMARDLLTVQASTVASESAFSLSGRILNERRSRLTETSLQICICYKDHLDALRRRQHVSSIENSEEELEDEISNLSLGSTTEE